MIFCKFCEKECKSKHSLNSHQPLCKKNPNGKNPASWATGNRKGVPSWNTGLSGDIRCQKSEETKNKLSIAILKRSKEFNKEMGKKISATINKKVAEGTWHTSLAKDMHINYNGVDLHGSWELEYAKYLDYNKIKWMRNKDTFKYIFEDKERQYTPDFYLLDTKEYIEIKGYKTDKDNAKWKQFPENKILKILMKKDLIMLDIKINN